MQSKEFNPKFATVGYAVAIRYKEGTQDFLSAASGNYGPAKWSGAALCWHRKDALAWAKECRAQGFDARVVRTQIVPVKAKQPAKKKGGRR